ncbi:MAG TPA: 2-oxoacid:acceptor oxidoreductase family protein [Bryobacteraceae bacterium]|nr:2-oxoacid:acceptor oxidoreductase family protein [Bryobacteraceae bacterium]
MSEMTVTHGRSSAFYDRFERKADAQHQTHYCPGCGHGIVTKLLARAIDELGVQDRTVLVSPVGCSVFGYYYFDVGNIQAAHGRAAAVATAVKRSRPGAIVVSYQGDGDLGAIGTAEIVHAANRGEPITVIFVNNGIYGMTGGQMAPTTPLGKKSTTSPFGRDAAEHGYPLRIAELLASLEAPVFVERVALGNNKQIISAARVIQRALENQVRGIGFSLVEVLSPCPTIWKLDPVDAQKFVREEMASIFPIANFRDRTKDASLHRAPPTAPDLADLPRILGLAGQAVRVADRSRISPVVSPSDLHQGFDYRIRVAGFGGQGVLTLGEVLAEAGLASGCHVSWLPSYGPEMRSGTSNCHVRLSARPVDSPLVSRPNVLLALNEPSLRKFLTAMEPGGVVIYNAREFPSDCDISGLHAVAIPCTEIADSLGSAKAGNIAMLGALMEATGLLEDEPVQRSLRRVVKSEKWYDIDLAALEHGRQAMRAVPVPVSDEQLWGV